MDLLPLAGMVFSLLTILLIGGFILLFPVARQLGKYLEAKIEERTEWGGLPEESLDELQSAVQGLEREVARLSERQVFLERLLEGSGPREALPQSAGSDDHEGTTEAGGG